MKDMFDLIRKHKPLNHTRIYYIYDKTDITKSYLGTDYKKVNDCLKSFKRPCIKDLSGKPIILGKEHGFKF